MAHQVLFIQGGGADGTHDEWDDKLVESLGRELGPEYEIRYPRMPSEADPKYARWSAALEQEFRRLDDGVIVVGHSIGGTILINSLVEDPPERHLAGIFLVAAPFVGEGGWPGEDIEPKSGLGRRLPAQTPVYLYADIRRLG
jgi:predicted alpha/beta hydrolase family esterase